MSWTLFYHMSLVEANFNNRFDNIDDCLDRFDQRMNHLKFDVHHLYSHDNLQCQWTPPPHPSFQAPQNPNDQDNNA